MGQRSQLEDLARRGVRVKVVLVLDEEALTPSSTVCELVCAPTYVLCTHAPRNRPPSRGTGRPPR